MSHVTQFSYLLLSFRHISQPRLVCTVLFVCDDKEPRRKTGLILTGSRGLIRQSRGQLSFKILQVVISNTILFEELENAKLLEELENALELIEIYFEL